MFVIGITGGSGSGKTTIVKRLCSSSLGSSIALLPHDSYYLNREEMPEAVRVVNNWDHPDALDNRLFLKHIEALKSGLAIQQPIYDFAAHARTTETTLLEPRPILLVEGILLFALPEIREQLDLRVFVDTPVDLRFLRRLKRDVEERGRSIESVFVQYQQTVRPMHNQFVEPSKEHAHLIVPWEFRNERAVEVIAAILSQKSGLDSSFRE